MVLSQERSLQAFFSLYMPTTPPYESLCPSPRTPRMWSVERDPRAPLGRRGAQQGGLVVVFGGSLGVAVEPPRVALVYPMGRSGVPRECMTSAMRANGRPTRVGYREGPRAASR